MRNRHLKAMSLVLVLFGSLLASPLAFAQCGCPSDGHGAKLVASDGLGQSFPMAGLVAKGAQWQVYEFQREGVRYLQINDRAGNIRAAVGVIGGTMWVLPMGMDADRVQVATVQSLAPASARRVFGNEELAIDYALDADRRLVWTMRILAQAR